MKRIFLHLLLFVFAQLSYANNVYFHHLGNKDNLPQLNIYSIYQDETGAMWFGTVEGLCRYNGTGTQVFTAKEEEGLTQNTIHTIYGNKKGSLYLNAGGDLVKYNLVNEQFECIKRGGLKEITYREGVLWFATNYDVFQYREEEEQIFQYTTIERNLGAITALTVTNENHVWIGRMSGLTIATSSNPQEHKNVLKNVHVRFIFVDSKNYVWVTTNDHGLYKLDLAGNVIAHYVHQSGKNSLSSNQVRTILEDDFGRLWIGTYFGLNYFDPETEIWCNYVHDANRPHSLSHSSVFALYKDIQGTLWVGTYFGGVNYFNPQTDIFHFYNAASQGTNSLSFPFVGNMVEDRHGKLWICIEGGGLNCLDLSTREFSHYLYEGPKPELALNYNLKSIWYHKEKDRLFLGVHNGGLGIFDIPTKKFRLLNETTQSALAANSVRGLQYYKGDLIFLNASGLHKLDLATEKIYPIGNDTLTQMVNSSFIYHFYIDSRDRLWLASYGMQCIDLKTGKREFFQYEKDKPGTIGKFKITAICETKNGDLFFGTAGSGVFKYNPDAGTFENYTEDNKKVISNFCYHIFETNENNLVLLHNNGMAIFDPVKGSSIYKSPDNFPVTSFFDGNTSYITTSNELFVGGTNGLVSFSESKLMNLESLVYSLYFDKLHLNGKRVVPNDETKILTKALPFCDKIKLKHNQNSISVQFASSNYSQNAMHNYEYKLDGFDKDWNLLATNTIVYTNLNPGDYKLTVREVQPESDKAKSHSLYISISTPFYKSTVAYMVYLLLVAAAIAGTIRFFVWRSKLKLAVELERSEKEQNEKMNQMKLRFFTNISHELRTPLTLIIAQTEYILQNGKTDTNIQQRNRKILRNAEHMYELISELLYFRKLEQGFYKLKVRQTGIVLYTKELYESFQDYAYKRNIRYNFVHPNKEINVYIDPAQFGKAIYNLLSNAFKYTSNGGEITIRIQQDTNCVLIQVEDNGIGIPSDKLAEIFVRFYQVEYRTSGFSLGTGIGLALTKEIVESHHGEITVHSTVNKGSLFEIKLPLGSAHFLEEELVNDAQVSWQTYEKKTQEEETEHPADSVQVSDNELFEFSILIVEDNEELLELLKDAFSKKYKVYTALNGKEGLEKVLDLQPSIVLSDVMMPEMSGKEMCYKIKNNINLAHIPVVLLTAQNSVDQTIEGYMFGADDYVTKPFNMDILITRCNSIIKNRQLLYRNIAKPDNSVISFDIQTGVDKELIDRATAIIKENFENPEFDMDMLATKLGLGRNKLYTKIKDITNLTPNEFTLNLKLQESVNLLEHHKHLNVADIAVQLGFSTKYFSRCFKTFYGVTPMQWRKDKFGDN
ncbi:hybrid sensor histidine kinase/response regulator transcription factor [Bacteroides sp. 519]|uniref:hybrid sensor histidine kinase/response regulator transcription factor n=1 Tax=Bacteroides sp. 519 TaxID=2302937 RepID=UPI0013CF4014|nr:hybrid sensor histidine kinase/response regulator transcription factor [Bacteroides sp. 519]NDV57749.1 hybrid sensor histidine kinase/response regulator [Bacteroides sp. 519]